MKRILTNGPALITAGICVLLILPLLVMDGMFMDAVIYSAVGRNLAEGTGTFWFPYFSEAHMASPTFHEHPPLAFGFMALFYKLFGSGIHTERIYTGVTFIITAVLIVKFWRMIWPTHYKMAWLPVLLWVITPLVMWSFRNNMLENTMGLFVLGGTMAAYRGFKADTRHFYWAAWAGLLVVCGFMVKGLPALFVWTTPVAFALAERKNFWKSILQVVIMMVVAGIATFALYMYEPARESLDIYLFERTANRLNSVGTTDNSFTIVKVLLENLIVPFGLTILVGTIFSRINKERLQWSPSISALLFMGLAGSVPFMLTTYQYGHYLVPVIPFFALAFASMLRPIIEKTTSKWRRNVVLQISGWVLIGVGIGISVYTAGKVGRDSDQLHDVRILRDNLESGTILETDAATNSYWSFKAYLERYAHIRLSDRIQSTESAYQLVPKGAAPNSAHPIQSDISVQLIEFDLYEADHGE
ncbi:ArnT family glycosyltransferase [Phaeocystidibacter marisrubri]|uniref:Uncharacterized protein n=1 Tax=Phaeocystidibacter marisrubri TaxID=1577780 RepID=A0A6L3ZEH6_9FLAO|nr:glycosyltransferase family 39 protein [Phaeocystidibacter marisrubri]KAB2815080.1 hypothetical protein F8C82_13340 [Phaeocystidibacter marisrubri]